MEAHVAASCIQRTVYIYTQKSGNGEYYWERFDPLPPHTLKGVFIRWNGTVEWNSGMEWWNSGMTTPVDRGL